MFIKSVLIIVLAIGLVNFPWRHPGCHPVGPPEGPFGIRVVVCETIPGY